MTSSNLTRLVRSANGAVACNLADKAMTSHRKWLGLPVASYVAKPRFTRWAKRHLRRQTRRVLAREFTLELAA